MNLWEQVFWAAIGGFFFFMITYTMNTLWNAKDIHVRYSKYYDSLRTVRETMNL